MLLKVRPIPALLGGAGAYIIFHYISAFAFLFFYLSACTVALALRLNRGRMLAYNSAFVLPALPRDIAAGSRNFS
jgi:hypothetical protein